MTFCSFYDKAVVHVNLKVHIACEVFGNVLESMGEYAMDRIHQDP